jgi:hypothetical protein
MGRQFRPGPHVLFQDLDAEVVLLNLSSGVYYGAGGVGSRVWKLLLEGKTTEEIVAQVVREYDTTPDRASADVAAFLADLERHQLVEGHDG